MKEKEKILNLLESIASGDFDEGICEQADYLWRINKLTD